MSFPTLKVELSLDKPGVSAPSWQDVTDYVTTVSVKRGRVYELDSIQAGTCQMTLTNIDRRFDPSYTLGPYYGGLRPMNRIRVSATFNSVTYYLFTGFVERWPPAFSRPQWNTVSITATDAFMALSNALISGTFAAKATGARISDVLSGWTIRVYAASTVLVPSADVPSTQKSAALGES